MTNSDVATSKRHISSHHHVLSLECVATLCAHSNARNRAMALVGYAARVGTGLKLVGMFLPEESIEVSKQIRCISTVSGSKGIPDALRWMENTLFLEFQHRIGVSLSDTSVRIVLMWNPQLLQRIGFVWEIVLFAVLGIGVWNFDNHDARQDAVLTVDPLTRGDRTNSFQGPLVALVRILCTLLAERCNNINTRLILKQRTENIVSHC